MNIASSPVLCTWLVIHLLALRPLTIRHDLVGAEAILSSSCLPPCCQFILSPPFLEQSYMYASSPGPRNDCLPLPISLGVFTTTALQCILMQRRCVILKELLLACIQEILGLSEPPLDVQLQVNSEGSGEQGPHAAVGARGSGLFSRNLI